MIPLALALALALGEPADKPKAAPPTPPTLDEQIASALKASPDVKLAEEKRQTAEAEVEQVRLLVALKVNAAVAKVEVAKAKVEAAEIDVRTAKLILETGAGSLVDRAVHLRAGPALAAAKAELAAAEAELKLLVGMPTKLDAKPDPAKPVRPTAMPSGPVVEKLEAALRGTYKLEFKETDVPTAFANLMTAAKMEDVPVRGMRLLGGDRLQAPAKLRKVSGQNTFDGWVELFADELNNDQAGLPNDFTGHYEVYVREYGLLVERADRAPKDAPTLTEFARFVKDKQPKR